jgi:transmembrane sensor
MTEQKIIPIPDAKKIEATAAHWIVRADVGDLSEKELLDFQAWLEKSEHHRAAYARLQGVWGEMDSLNNLNDYAASIDNANSDDESSPSFLFSYKSVGLGIAASLVILVFTFVLPIGVFNNSDFSPSYVTAVGEQQVIELPDGSSIILNTGSHVDVEYSDSSRNIFLTRGEAYFDVAKNPSAPFIVRTQRGLVTAVGTAFSVRVQEAQVNVVVTEGRVALTPIVKTEDTVKSAAMTPSVLMEVTAGQVVAFAERIESLEPIEPAAIERVLDWRDGVISFKGESLEQVISHISPYTSLKIEIEGEELRQKPIGGYFKVGEIEALFDALKLMANVEIEMQDNQHVRLYQHQ